MTEQDFDQSFAAGMDAEQDFGSSQTGWGQLMPRLDQLAKDRRRRRWGLVILPWALATAVAGSAFLRLAQAKEQQEALATRLSILEASARQQPTTRTDTVYRTVVAHHYDTVFQTIYRQERLSGHTLPFGEATHGLGLNPSGHIAGLPTAGEGVWKGDALTLRPISDKASAWKNSLQLSSDRWSELMPLSPRPLPGLSLAGPPAQLDSVAAKKPALHRHSVRYYFQPRGLRIGAVGGPVLAVASPRQRGFLTGVQGELVFYHPLRLTAGIEYLPLHYEAEGPGPALDIPPVTPPSPEHFLDNVLVRQPYLRFALGLKQVFYPRRSLQPYLGLGIVAHQRRSGYYKYEFVNFVTGEKTLVQRTRHEPFFRADGLRGCAGLEWHFQPRWSCQLEGSFQRNLQHRKDVYQDLWGLKTGIFYGF